MKRLNILHYLQRREKYGYTNMCHEKTEILLVGRSNDIDWFFYD